eukprot:365059_1
MSLWLIIICILLTNSNGETLLNPTESEYHCGINEDCTIQCNVSQVCNNIKFYVYNHKVSFECSGDSSCVETKLIASNVTELTIIVTGFQALLSAEVIVDSSNTKVNTVCNGLRTCYHARFHYNSKETVDHVCDGDRGCWYASIHAVSPIKLHCKNTFNHNTVCSYLSVVWPTNNINAQQSSIIIDFDVNYDGPYYLYVPNTAYVPNITCPSACNNTVTNIIYGSMLDQYCKYKDSSCDTAILAYNDNVDANTLSNEYYNRLNSSNYQFQQNALVVIYNQGNSIIFSSVNAGQISVLCFLCEDTVFDFSSLSNVSFTAVKAVRRAQIYGPSNYFLSSRIYIGPSIWNNIWESQFFLEDTTSIRFNGIPESYGGKAVIYLSNQVDVNLNGGLINETNCMGSRCNVDGPTQIVQSIGDSVQAVMNYGWSISCSSYECLIFNLSTNYPTINPTQYPVHPTLEPIMSTINPSFSPSFNPMISTLTVTTPVLNINITINDNGLTVEQVINTVNISVREYFHKLSVEADYKLVVDTIGETKQVRIIVFNLFIESDENAKVDNDELKNDIQDDLDNEYGKDKTYVVITDAEERFQKQQSFLQHVTAVIAVILMLIILGSYIYATFFRKNDFYKLGSLISAAFHILDSLSDIFFAIQVTYSPDFGHGSSIFFIIFILCVIFIIVPTSITLIQLYHATSKHWNRNDEIRAWMTQYIYILYMISIVCGSAFTGIQLCRSNMFDLPVFDMPLTRKDALKFETKKKIYITIIF